MKRTITIAISGFILVCLMASHALGADEEWVYWWPPSSNAIGGYRVTARPLNPSTNAPPALPVVWNLQTNEITVAAMDARLPVGTNEVTAISIGGEMVVTNFVPGTATGAAAFVPIVVTNFIANSPPSLPKYHKVVEPLVTKYIAIKIGTEVTSLRMLGGLHIYSDTQLSNLIINLKQ